MGLSYCLSWEIGHKWKNCCCLQYASNSILNKKSFMALSHKVDSTVSPLFKPFTLFLWFQVICLKYSHLIPAQENLDSPVVGSAAESSLVIWPQ